MTLAQLRRVPQAAENADAGTLPDCRAGVCRLDALQGLPSLCNTLLRELLQRKVFSTSYRTHKRCF